MIFRDGYIDGWLDGKCEINFYLVRLHTRLKSS